MQTHEPFASRPVIRSFIARFFFIFVGMELLLTLFPPLGYQQWIAVQIGNMLHVPVSGTFLFVGNAWFEISAFCSGLTTFALFAGLVLGFDIPSMEKKLGFLLSGAFLIFILNIIRIYFVVWMGIHSSIGAAEAFHILSWFILSAIITVLWFILLKNETGARTHHELARQLLGK